MESKLFDPFYIELKKAFEILETLQMIVERFQETLTIRPYSKEEIISLYKDIRMYLREAGLIFEIILDRITKYGPKDESLYNTISHFYKEIDDIDIAFWNTLSTYEKDPIKGADKFYKISIESLKTIGKIIDFIARELNL
jgi:hypothetical protein